MEVPCKTSFLTSYLNIAKSIEKGMRINIMAVLINLLQEDNFLLDIFFSIFAFYLFKLFSYLFPITALFFCVFFFKEKICFSAIIEVNSSLEQIVYQYKNS